MARIEPFSTRGAEQRNAEQKKLSISLRKKGSENVLLVEDVKQNVSRVNSNVDLVETFIAAFPSRVVRNLLENFPDIIEV